MRVEHDFQMLQPVFASELWTSVKESEFHCGFTEPKVLKDSYGRQTLLIQRNSCRNDDENDEDCDFGDDYGKVGCEDNGG